MTSNGNGFLTKWILGIITAVITVSLSAWLVQVVYMDNQRINVNSSRLAVLETSAMTMKETLIKLERYGIKNQEDHSIINQNLIELKTLMRIKK